MNLLNTEQMKAKVNKTQAEISGMIKEVKLSLLKPSSNNFYAMSDIDGLVASISEQGQIVPILVDENFNILSGHRRYTALKQMGSETARVEIREGLSNIDKQLILIEANRQRVKTTEEFQEEVARMKELVKQKKLEDPNFKGTTLEIVAEMLNVSLATVKRADRKNRGKGSFDPKQKQFNTTLKVDVPDLVCYQELVQLIENWKNDYDIDFKIKSEYEV